MKLCDTTYEYSNAMRTSVSNQILQMSQGLKSKFMLFFSSFANVFLIVICLALVKVTLFPYLVTFLNSFSETDLGLLQHPRWSAL